MLALAHWRFNKGDALPDELFELRGCTATFGCDVVIYDDADGRRKLIGTSEPLVVLNCTGEGTFNARKKTVFCVDHELPPVN
jgi:hypothetical protein